MIDMSLEICMTSILAEGTNGPSSQRTLGRSLEKAFAAYNVNQPYTTGSQGYEAPTSVRGSATYGATIYNRK